MLQQEGLTCLPKRRGQVFLALVPVSPNSTLAEIANLSIDEQLDALSTIWDTIVAKEPVDVQDDVRDLLERRLAEDAEKPGIPWQDLKAQLLARLR